MQSNCLLYFVFLLLYGCLCSLSLPRGAVGYPVVCDCGISSAYSIVFYSVLVCTAPSVGLIAVILLSMSVADLKYKYTIPKQVGDIEVMVTVQPPV